ncbi:MAG: hypothetical protein ACH37Z_18990, partial [Anaerolineae bacterium]
GGAGGAGVGGHLIEQALSHHLLALEELPADVVIPARMVLSQESTEVVLEAIRQPQAPTEAMRQRFDDRGDPPASG